MEKDSNSSIMSIGELIDTAFGEPDINVVHHKLIQTILYILARQLRVLDRRVEVNLMPGLQTATSSLSVTEVKVHAMQKKKRRPVKGVASGLAGRGQPGKGIKSQKVELPKIGTPTAKTSEHPSSSDKTTSEQTSSGKTSTDKTSADKTSTDKTTTDKTSTDVTSSSKKSTDKTSSSKSTDGTSSSKKSTDKTSSSKSTSDKTSSEKPSSSDKTSSDKTSSEKSSSKDKSSSDKQPTNLKSIDEKPSLDNTSQITTPSDTRGAKKGTRDYVDILEEIEQQREVELRVIHQRADSQVEPKKTPTPMASLDSVEATYEKLLVVERVPSEEARARAARGRSSARDKTPRLSVVTQEQFENLAAVVRQLQQKFGPIPTPGFPENAKLMEELRKGASLTDAMGALQLSARLEANEKTLEQLLSLVTELASKLPGIDMTAAAEDDIQVIFGGSQMSAAKSRKSTITKQPRKSKSVLEAPVTPSERSVEILLSQPLSQVDPLATTAIPTTDDGQTEQKDQVTHEELEIAIDEVYDEIMKQVTRITTISTTNANNAFKMTKQLEGKLESSFNLGLRMDNLQAMVDKYVAQINVLDTVLSSQMSNYQEELTQMQHDLESGLETMAEMLANTGCDVTVIAELNTHFTDLQLDIDNGAMKQNELRDIQNGLALDFAGLRKQIEVLSETKSDRDEVADALRDKAGIGELNGLVSMEQFNAVRGDIEKRIGAAYEKFNNQELVWQKALEDLLRELTDKADTIQVVGLRDDINKHLETLRSRVQVIAEIVGEPRAAALQKRLRRDAACLSCSTPAHMDLEAPATVPALPAMRPHTIGAEVSKPMEDGDHGVCYPGYPLPHPRDPRSHVCRRWCGGSHTMLANTVSRAPAGMIVTPVMRELTTEMGTDGKFYLVDRPKMACSQCNIQKTTPEPSESTREREQVDDAHSDMTPPDFRHTTYDSMLPPGSINVSVTPPPPIDND